MPNQPQGDSARLQNIICFLADIKDTVGFMSTQWWAAGIEGLICRERQGLFDTRRTEAYRTGRGTFDHYGNRASPQFIPAALQDLITLTIEILARDTVATAAREQREAFREASQQLGQVAAAHAQESARVQARMLPHLSPTVLDWAFAQSQAAEIIEMVRRALEPVLVDLQVQIPTPRLHGDDHAAPAPVLRDLRVQMPTPRSHVDDDKAPAPQMPAQQISSSAPPAIVPPKVRQAKRLLDLLPHHHLPLFPHCKIQ